MRNLVLTSLLGICATACGGGGGGGGGQQGTPHGNPAPSPPSSSLAINMNGRWRVTLTQLVEVDDPSPSPLPEGVEIVVQGGVAVAVTSGTASVSLDRAEYENRFGFTLDWYSNQGTGTAFEFGYGWDRLRVPGGGGAFRDFHQYGMRLAAVSDNALIGYEAAQQQDFLNAPRTSWVAWHVFTRVQSLPAYGESPPSIDVELDDARTTGR